MTYRYGAPRDLIHGLSWSTRGDAILNADDSRYGGFIGQFSGTVLPDCGVAPAVEHGQNDDSTFFRSKVHAEWKPIGNDTANILVNRGVSHGPLKCGVQTSFDFGNEVHAKVWPLTFVPCRRFDEFHAGGTTKGNR
jgi:hypothetical protein